MGFPPKRPLTAERWCKEHRESIARADEIISERLEASRVRGEHTATALCDEVLAKLRTCVSDEAGGESRALLLLGEAGSGKSHLVEWCLEKLRQSQPSVIVLRAHGSAYANDVDCVRHLVSQVASQLVTQLRPNASFEESMRWFRGVLQDSFQHGGAVVLVVDRFENFCSSSRQTLLYNLFEIVQGMGLKLTILGTSEKMDVMGLLEKRVKSRFSMLHFNAKLPATMEELVAILMSKLRLPATCGLSAAFQRSFHANLESALRAKEQEWRGDLDLGRPPCWFLWRCLPVAALLQEALPGAEAGSGAGLPAAPAAALPETPVKRRRLCPAPSQRGGDVRRSMLSSLSDAEHIILLALHRLRSRKASRTLNMVLHELRLLHEANSFMLGTSWRPDWYCAAFDRLVHAKLITFVAGIRGSSTGEVPKRYMPCESVTDEAYGALLWDLERHEEGAASGCAWNPLRRLPHPLQRWAAEKQQ